MPLRRKMVLQITATIVGLLLTISASLWGIHGLRADYSLALNGYGDLRRVYEAGSHLATARTVLSESNPDRAVALREVHRARDKFAMLRPSRDNGARSVQFSKLDGVKNSVASAAARLSGAEGNAEDLEAVGQALKEVSDLAADIRQQIVASQIAAQAKWQSTVEAMLLVFAIAVMGTIVLGIWQYMGVMRPLEELGTGVRRLAGGNFAQRLSVAGKDELASLAADFNRMADQLDEQYQSLEKKVADKSRELVRSERLASVGYLAAGMAHEINNPLGIISGHAEMMLEQLRQLPLPATEENQSLIKSLTVICEEAFRCKAIIAKLFSLSRGGEDRRERVDLSKVVRQVIAMIGGLANFRDRRIDLIDGRANNPMVLANEAEMKQVVLNLLLNALEAGGPADAVEVKIVADNALVCLSVIDHGKGMTPETAQRVFEPFYTEKKGTAQNGAGDSGMGLGLSITHAIVSSHGGRIWGESDGLGKGSRFSVEFPIANSTGATA